CDATTVRRGFQAAFGASRRPCVGSAGAAVAAARGAGLVHHHLRQRRQARLQALPDPGGEALAGRVLQPRYLVQVMVVQLLVQRPEGGLDVGEVHDPAGVLARLPRDVQLDPERVPVQARALVPFGHVRQAVRGLQGEDLEDVHAQSSAGTRTAPSISTRALRLITALVAVQRPSTWRASAPTRRVPEGCPKRTASRGPPPAARFTSVPGMAAAVAMATAQVPIMAWCSLPIDMARTLRSMSAADTGLPLDATQSRGGAPTATSGVFRRVAGSSLLRMR